MIRGIKKEREGNEWIVYIGENNKGNTKDDLCFWRKIGEFNIKETEKIINVFKEIGYDEIE